MTTHRVFPPTVRRLVPALTAAVLAAGVAAAGPAQAAGIHRRPSMPIHVARGVVAAADHVHPGMTHVRNTGRAPILLIAKKHLDTRALLRDLNDNSDAEPSRLARDFTVLDYVGGHSDAYLRLSRGTLFLVAANPRHFSPRSISTATVSGQVRNTPVPASNRIAVSPGGLSAPARVAGHHYLHLVDNTRLVQEFVGFRPRAGVSEAEIAQFVARPTFARLSEIWVATPRILGIVTRGHGAYVRAPHGTGRYIILTLGFRPGHAYPILHAAATHL